MNTITTMLTERRPIRGPEYDPARPETRAPWMDMRRGGITATEVRDWGNGAKRREILTFKVTGESQDLSGIAAVDHGNRREPVIAEWVERLYGITPCNAVYSHPDNPRFLASPDGITLDPFTGDLMAGAYAAVAEIKTSKHDLNPGRLDGRHLIQIDPDSYFHRAGYYTQIQWQMFVMNADRTLFVWEQHDGTIDPDTGTYRPVGVPQAVWIDRDQPLIDVLVEKVAIPALAEIDAARAANTAGELPPASALPSEHAVLVADLLRARDAEAIAKAAKDKAWKALQDYYLAEGRPDETIDAGIAQVTVSTSTTLKEHVDMAVARAKAPALVDRYEALIARHTKTVPVTTRRLTVTAKQKELER